MEKDNNPIQRNFYSLQFPFENKVFFYPRSLIYKGHKIFLAVYLATDHLTAEPLAQQIRQAAVSFFNSFFDHSIESLQNEGTRLVALIESASFLQLLSGQNSAILTSEVRSVLERLVTSKQQLPVYLTKDFFAVPEMADQDRVINQSVTQKDIKDIKRHFDFPTTHQQKISYDIKDKQVYSASQNPPLNSQRTSKIVEFLKEKGPVSIREIKVLFKDVSEKTIQRELAQLVSEGRVIKSGERRWSTYMFKA